MLPEKIMGIDFRNGLYISYNFYRMIPYYGGTKVYINIPLRIAISVIRYQLRLLAEDGYYPVLEDKIPHEGWWWGYRDEECNLSMNNAELCTVYATILKIHLTKLEKDFAKGRRYCVEADAEGIDEDPLIHMIKIDSARKIQRMWRYYSGLKNIQDKYG